jgi:hypothetical protein
MLVDSLRLDISTINLTTLTNQLSVNSTQMFKKDNDKDVNG